MRDEPEELIGKTLVAITNLPPRKMMGIESCGMLLSAVNNLKDSEDEELHLLMVDNHIPAGAKLYQKSKYFYFTTNGEPWYSKKIISKLE